MKWSQKVKYFAKRIMNIGLPKFKVPVNEVSYDVTNITCYSNRPGTYEVKVVMTHNGMPLTFDIPRMTFKPKHAVIREEFEKVYLNRQRIEDDCAV